jgi:mannitol/fructose-specific phosphotransferase system IIA component
MSSYDDKTTNEGEKLNEYAVYKGDSLIVIGTIKECAEHMGVLQKTVRYYLTPTYEKRLAKRKKARNYITVFKLDDE